MHILKSPSHTFKLPLQSERFSTTKPPILTAGGCIATLSAVPAEGDKELLHRLALLRGGDGHVKRSQRILSQHVP